jgi:uncharacterized membrane protein YkvA (DUF1232 family)
MNPLLLARYLRSPQVARWKKALGLLAVAYVLLPVDLVPDVVPLLGWLDDVGVVAAVAAFLVRDVQRFAARGPASEAVIDAVAMPR